MTGRRTKLACTLGPATDGIVAELVAAGMDVARVNLSHGTPAEQERRLAAAAAAGADRPVATLADLPGPKIRLGELPKGRVELRPGERFVLAGAGRPPRPGSATTTYAALATDLRPGDRVLLADGAAELRVASTDGADVVTEVVRGGIIRSRQGVSVPSERLSAPSVTDADRTALHRALDGRVDYVAQSFVRRAADVESLRRLMAGRRVPIVAKIETRAAVEDLEAILGVVDAVMIARGDLGVEIPFEEVPIVQKRIVRRARERGVPTIVATQMLESMIDAPRPTRAEASDVANAVLDGADAVMLSAETAVGAFPLEAARAAVAIAHAAEGYVLTGGGHAPASDAPSEPNASDAIVRAAVALAQRAPAIAAIVCYTMTGRTAARLSELRPRVPILAVSPRDDVLRRLSLHNSVVPVRLPPDARGEVDVLAAPLLQALGLPDGALVAVLRSSSVPSERNELALLRVGDASPARPDMG